MSKRIAVYADWDRLSTPLRLGFLHTHEASAREVFEFEFDATALKHRALLGISLDPRLGHFPGKQYAHDGSLFGCFTDASPDRWGRMLMQRRLERDQRKGLAGKNARLRESDFLLGVHDHYRVGALRFRLDDAGDFLDDRHDQAAPPFVRLRELQEASRALERDTKNKNPQGDAWLRMLIAPGGSLGGARPKASVVDPDEHLWIAKFPSVRDEIDVGAWELIASMLSDHCGIRTPERDAKRFAGPHHTFMVKRFDRKSAGKRLHFASAMTLTGHQDGDDASTGVSYLELARVLIEQGAQTGEDLRELWTRIVFNLLISNADDHLRNHGFILQPGKGWRRSEVFDLNPVPHADGLKLNISEADNAMDLDLARSVADQFRLKLKAADTIIDQCSAIVRQWPKLANHLGIPRAEQQHMAPAFSLAG